MNINYLLLHLTFLIHVLLFILNTFYEFHTAYLCCFFIAELDILQEKNKCTLCQWREWTKLWGVSRPTLCSGILKICLRSSKHAYHFILLCSSKGKFTGKLFFSLLFLSLRKMIFFFSKSKKSSDLSLWKPPLKDQPWSL